MSHRIRRMKFIFLVLAINLHSSALLAKDSTAIYQLTLQEDAAFKVAQAEYQTALELLPLASSARKPQIDFRVLRSLRDAGTRTSVDVLISVRATFRAQRDYTSARYNFLVDTLKHATGLLIIEGLHLVNRWSIR